MAIKRKKGKMNKKQTRQEKLNEIKKEIEEIRQKPIIAKIVSVSRSGMTRKIDFYIAKNDGYLRWINHILAVILDEKTDKNGQIVASGCGMDVIFHTLSNVNYAMATIDTNKTLNELLKTKECGKRIYDNYFINADKYQLI